MTVCPLCRSSHTLDNLYWIRCYVHQFTTALSPEASHKNPPFKGFSQRNYIDLLCGPGLCVVQKSRTEEPGSSIVALSAKYPFSHYYFVDVEDRSVAALKQRIDRGGYAPGASKRYFVGDCNERVHDILDSTDLQASVNLAVVDGFSIECHWSTVELPASCRRMDLIILYPQGMTINRNLHIWATERPNALDEFFGTTDWRKIYQGACGQPSRCIRGFLDLYQDNLRRLGYADTDQVHEELVRSAGGQKLYYLIFASRHPLGHQFWKQAAEKRVSGQLRLLD